MSCHYTTGRQTRVLFFCLCLLAGINSALAETRAFSIAYNAENDYLSAGTATWSLTRDESNWIMRLSTSPNRLIRMAGVGKVIETTVLSAPEPPFRVLAYSYSDSKRKKKNYSATFSQERDDIAITRHDQTITIPASGDIIDRLSATLAISTELTKNPTFEKLYFKVLDRNGVRDVEYSNLGVETIRLGKRRFKAHVVESIRPGSSRRTRTWFSIVDNTDATQRLLPVKIEQYKKKELVLRLSLRNYTLYQD